MIPENPKYNAQLKSMLGEASPAKTDTALTDAIMQAVMQQQAQKVDTKADTRWSVWWTLVAFLLILLTIIALPYMANYLTMALSQWLPSGRYIAVIIISAPALGLIFYRIDSLSKQWLNLN